jgi:hypothetical protein
VVRLQPMVGEPAESGAAGLASAYCRLAHPALHLVSSALDWSLRCFHDRLEQCLGAGMRSTWRNRGRMLIV